MNALVGAGCRAIEVLAEHGVESCVIGGLAVARWGEPRLTADVDLVAMSAVTKDELAVDALLEEFQPRIVGAREFALAHRVLLLKDIDGIPLDVSLGALDFEAGMIARSSLWIIEQCNPLRTCSAEDLIVTKTFASRDRDWNDIRGIIARQGSALDRTAVIDRFAPLAEYGSDPGASARLRALLSS